jgi:hypothetical protein
MKKTALLSFVFFAFVLHAQVKKDAAFYAQNIAANSLKKHLTILASDVFEGRETGKKGQQLAAQYLINSFRNSGCFFVPGMQQFEQFFSVVEVQPGGNLTINNSQLQFKKDFIYFGSKRKFELNNTKIITFSSKSTTDTTSNVLVHTLQSNDVRAEVTALKKGLSPATKALVLVATNYSELYEYLEHYTTNKSMRLSSDEVKKELPIIVVNATAIAPILNKEFLFLTNKKQAKNKSKKTTVGTLSCQFNLAEKELISSNVLAFIPGSDSVLKNEVLVITAHYDHIGIDNGVVYNGADDDGTGTVALIEIAAAFMNAYKDGNGPKRSILIMPVSGEEKGLLGSSYYASHPALPLATTIADLNIDMIGRDDIAHEGKSDYIYIIGSNMLSDDLHATNEQANNTFTQLQLDYRFNSTTDPNQFYYRSDHYNFAKNNIPSIFYFSGVHADYHQPTDDVEKINFDKVEKVTKLVFHTAWMLANNPTRPLVNH